MNELHLFAGAGGGILGGMLLGHTTVCAVEIEPYCRKVLLQRQHDGILPRFPIWDDVRTFDGKPWRGLVDVVCGGFPCQDISAAGKGAGIDGERSGLWSHMARIIGEIRPRFAFVENSPMLVSRGLGRVLGDLAEMGYDSRWGVVSAADAGAPHLRERIWILAMSNPDSEIGRGSQGLFGHGNDAERLCAEVADAASERQPEPWEYGHASNCKASREREANHADDDGQWWATEPNVGRVAHGVAARVDRLKAIGNGQVPQVAALAWRILTEDT
jgi:DNA (cytosine-5)-methyltransferase 1